MLEEEWEDGVTRVVCEARKNREAASSVSKSEEDQPSCRFSVRPRGRVARPGENQKALAARRSISRDYTVSAEVESAKDRSPCRNLEAGFARPRKLQRRLGSLRSQFAGDRREFALRQFGLSPSVYRYLLH